MRVGIISLFDNKNLGNRLQNYAVQQILLDYVDEVITIKNKPRFKTWKQKIMRSSFLAESVILNRIMGKKRKAKFLEFNKKYIKMNKRTYCFQRSYRTLYRQDVCDKYCVGSDQVWNPQLGRSGSFNYLGFAEAAKTFSLSASFGVDTIADEYANSVRCGLQHINHISVREVEGKKIIGELTGREDVIVLIDPTMMIPVEAWDEIAVAPCIMPSKKYGVCYFLGEQTDDRKKIIADLAQKKGCTIIDILDKDSMYYEMGPSEFIYLISNASFVFTDSFHASVFSFIYKKALVIFPRVDHNVDMSSRIRTLVELFHLEDNFADKDVVPANWDYHDYSHGLEVLRNEQQKARAFLNNVFSRE